jgi:hypothetical protein
MGENPHQKTHQESVTVAQKFEMHVVLSVCWQIFSNHFRKAGRCCSVGL